MKGLKKRLGRLPQRVIGHGAYGSEENYAYLEQEEVGNYVKHSRFDREQKRRKAGLFGIEAFVYDEDRDEFICPADRKVTYQSTASYGTENDYRIERRNYECADCAGCELKPACTRSAHNRRLQVSFALEHMKARPRSNLRSEEWVRLRSRRGVEVESVFGRLKHNWGFRKFLLRAWRT